MHIKRCWTLCFLFHSFTENNLTMVLRKLGFGINFVEPCLRKLLILVTNNEKWRQGCDRRHYLFYFCNFSVKLTWLAWCTLGEEVQIRMNIERSVFLELWSDQKRENKGFEPRPNMDWQRISLCSEGTKTNFWIRRMKRFKDNLPSSSLLLDLVIDTYVEKKFWLFCGVKD